MSTVAQRVADDKAAREFAQNLMSKMKMTNQDSGINLLQALWVHHRLRALDVTIMGKPFTLDVLNMVVSGDINIAKYVFDAMTPDDMTQPYHWFTQEKIDIIKADINAFLGL